MKKLVITSVALFALVGSITAQAQVRKPKPQGGNAPVPVCPANDPNGCGIYQ
ncbi:hypothetical protein Terro_0335 [Terriglobus roseus DSM 18391]|uniref:Uncharacterized protein n=1 Tax=Terriglobus roseus (strain DSM 18391 / NRRL B-41598 / KBS 63) TaxID=926566 RepID=I3ZBR6_TERRK|nr:hypothetical protein [Terriglobus roseus]AFL86684.1 hypothetical protein Terro_0335 [Terriglobus roseus DSM 18391]